MNPHPLHPHPQGDPMTPTLTITGTRTGLLEKLDLLERQDRLRQQQDALLETQARFATQLEAQARAQRAA